MFLGESAPNIDLGVPVFRIKDETEMYQEAKPKVPRCRLRVRTPFVAGDSRGT